MTPQSSFSRLVSNMFKNSSPGGKAWGKGFRANYGWSSWRRSGPSAEARAAKSAWDKHQQRIGAAAGIDLGWQPCAIKEAMALRPRPSMRTSAKFDWAKDDTSRYSLFGKLGQGGGGFSIQAKAGSPTPPLQEACQPLHVKAYPGGWVHHVKAIGAPPTQLPDGYSNRNLSSLRDKVLWLCNDMVWHEGPKMGGLRVEARLKPLGSPWAVVEEHMRALVSDVLAHSDGLFLDTDVLLTAALDAFSTVEAMNSKLTCMHVITKHQIHRHIS